YPTDFLSSRISLRPRRHSLQLSLLSGFFFFNDTATTEIYTLSLHDALPIWRKSALHYRRYWRLQISARGNLKADRKSTRLNSSHTVNAYVGFFLYKKKY